MRRIGECVTWKADSALGREALGGTRYDLVMSLRCAVLGRGLGRHVLRHRYSLYGHHLAVPCDKDRLLSSSHRPDFCGVWGGQGRAWGSYGVRAPTGPCWHGGRRQHGLARARLHFESGLGLCTPRRPCMRPRVPRAKARDRPAGAGQGGAWSCVTGGRAAGRDAHAKLRPGEAEAGAAPCDRLRRAVGRRSTQCPARRRRARRCIEAVLGSNLARVQAGSDEELHGAISRRSQPAARGMS